MGGRDNLLFNVVDNFNLLNGGTKEINRTLIQKYSGD
jgi:hypothetical protein